ncbi:hypothetical protein BCV69DRAFT_275262 [Microstroma glucosiphilum]|uniref:Nuclear speckle splicing regulatory protein 1 N-terminal domain-containing protein n=1 Tax=Pseudomicrostroma glucosiphilum TaxID=1684307 RepID=A0A316UFY1_9BASI|nr:hypothetical protein BCV69DRAFT_275262 [Pseudomicrostroma glucosiphilum]PWN23848.1 hypothetical protein BCV69DRAFT_275262 [Pseudomicrostroma glucosiphilum]
MSSSQGGPSGSTKISFGFKKTSLPAQTSVANPLLASKPKPPAFSSLEDEEDDDQGNAAASSSSVSSAFSQPKKKSNNAPTGLAHSAPASKVSRQKAAQAEQLDSSVYDYDNVFDSLKSVQRSQAEARQAERAKRDPKYIEGMLDSVKERNKLLLRAQAKKIQREREAEGEEFQEGEEFVTDAYREQQEELRKVEEAEKAEEEKQAKNKKGLSSFYKDMMASKEAEHEAAVAAAAAAAEAAARTSTSEAPGSMQGGQAANTDAPSGSLSEQDRQARLAKEASKRGLNAQLNDEGELVDQRSVLSAGLNVLGRDKKGSSRDDAQSSSSSLHSRHYSSSNGRGSARDGAAEARRLREEARERASRQVEEQILEVEAQREEERAKEEEQRKRSLIGERRNDESKIAEAKKRMEERRLKKRKLEEEEMGT